MAVENSKMYTRLRQGPTLIVASDRHLGPQIRQSLSGLGFKSISVAISHGQALERLRDRHFPLVLFEATASNVAPKDFVIAAKNLEQDSTLIALSNEPRIDQVFELLSLGTRSFLVLPFTSDVLESVVSRAVYGPPFSDAILEAVDRDGALAALILNSLYRLATAMRHARDFSTFLSNVEAYRRALVESVELAKTFSLGGNDVLREKIVDACIIRGQTAATRLGRTRKRLQLKRIVSQVVSEDDGSKLKREAK